VCDEEASQPKKYTSLSLPSNDFSLTVSEGPELCTSLQLTTAFFCNSSAQRRVQELPLLLASRRDSPSSISTAVQG